MIRTFPTTTRAGVPDASLGRSPTTQRDGTSASPILDPLSVEPVVVALPRSCLASSLPQGIGFFFHNSLVHFLVSDLQYVDIPTRRCLQVQGFGSQTFLAKSRRSGSVSKIYSSFPIYSPLFGGRTSDNCHLCPGFCPVVSSPASRVFAPSPPPAAVNEGRRRNRSYLGSTLPFSPGNKVVTPLLVQLGRGADTSSVSLWSPANFARVFLLFYRI